MNSKRLAGHYDTLSARERFALLAAARLRHDDIETERLLQTAPAALWRLPHHHIVAEAVCDLALLHLARLLDTIARLWRTNTLRETVFHFGGTGPKWRAREQRLDVMYCQFRMDLLVLDEGWKRFCAELKLDPEALLGDLPGYGMVQLALREETLSPEEAAAVSGSLETSPIALAAATVHAGYRATLENREKLDSQ